MLIDNEPELVDLKYYENLSLSNLWVIDVEQFTNFHSLCGLELKTGKQISFVVSEHRDDRLKYIKWLKSGINWITFNGLNYDYPLVHRVLEFEDYFLSNTIEQVVHWLYITGQKIIKQEQSFIPESNSYIKQYDLYRIFHFNNKAKSSSLKHIEFVLMWKLLQDLPFKFNHVVKREEIPQIIKYNFNDVFATLELWKLAVDEHKISLRETLSKQYKLNLKNADDVKIGSNLFAKILSEDMKLPMNQLLELRTILDEVVIKDLLLNYISFRTPEFNNVLDYFSSRVVRETKNAFHYEQEYRGVKLVYGTGGIHSLSDSNVFESDDEYVIVDADVKSFYPNLSIVNNFKPTHLGESFTKIYKFIYEERTKIPKSDPLNLAYKLILNGSYGKSNSEHSFLYDKSFMLSITCNGQLLLSMLIEMLTNPFSLDDVQIISANTDGVTLRLKKSLKSKIMDLCKDWEKLTGLELEYAYYSKMVQRDVNNYLSVYSDENGVTDYNSKIKVKTKGAFEIDKELHKNHSARIIPICLLHYYVYNKFPSDILKDYLTFSENNSNNPNLIVNGKSIKYHGVYDFFKEVKSKVSDKKGMSQIVFLHVDNGKLKESKLQKINRYLVTKRGGKLLKKYKSDKNPSQVVAGKFNMRIYNDLTHVKDTTFYSQQDNHITTMFNSINTNYYLKETLKIINSINKTNNVIVDQNSNNSQQLSLF